MLHNITDRPTLEGRKGPGNAAHRGPVDQHQTPTRIHKAVQPYEAVCRQDKKLSCFSVTFIRERFALARRTPAEQDVCVYVLGLPGLF